MLRPIQAPRPDRVQQLIEMRLQRAARRAENKAGWCRDERNANARHRMVMEATMAALDEPSSADIRSLDRLREIMSNPSVPLGRRVEAAEVVLVYELPSAALVRQSGEPIKSASYLFLRSVADTPGAPEALQFRALKALSTIESAKPARADPAAAGEERRMLIAAINNARRTALIRAKCWPVPPGTRWLLDWVDTFEEPPGLLPSISASEQHLLLLAITARGRDDVTWRQLLTQKSP